MIPSGDGFPSQLWGRKKENKPLEISCLYCQDETDKPLIPVVWIESCTFSLVKIIFKVGGGCSINKQEIRNSSEKPDLVIV